MIGVCVALKRLNFSSFSDLGSQKGARDLSDEVRRSVQGRPNLFVSPTITIA